VVSCEHRRGEIGYVLGARGVGAWLRNRGDSSPARLGFDELGLHKISANCDPENRPSVAVLTKNGMHQEGIQPLRGVGCAIGPVDGLW
jgi:[ribosomal protein S5]-alanine N-acetyltransferase